MENKKQIGKSRAAHIAHKLAAGFKVSDEEKTLLDDFNNRKRTPEAIQYEKEYFAKLNDRPEKKKLKWFELANLAARTYFEQNGVRLDLSNRKVKEFYMLLANYFTNESLDFSLYQSETDISFSKGLAVYGSFGTGKSSALRAFSSVLYGYDNYFKMYSAKKLVSRFEECATSNDKKGFFEDMYKGGLLIDDVLREPMASNYGKRELIEEILDGRYDRGLITHISMNVKSAEDGINKIEQRYGAAIGDRAYQMFNFVETDWNSFRK